MTDRLAEIVERTQPGVTELHQSQAYAQCATDVRWLIAEVERMRSCNKARDELAAEVCERRDAEVKRLRVEIEAFKGPRSYTPSTGWVDPRIAARAAGMERAAKIAEDHSAVDARAPQIAAAIRAEAKHD